MAKQTLQAKLLKLLDELEDLSPVLTEGKEGEEGGVSQELAAVLELDRSCRLSLLPMTNIIENIEIPHASYLIFLHAANSLLSLVEDCCLHVKASEAYTTMQNLTRTDQHFSLQEIFTMITIIIMSVALCIDEFDKETRTQALRLLDQLMNVKLQQLKLMNEMVDQGDSNGYIS